MNVSTSVQAPAWTDGLPTIRSVHLRRALLLFALVIGVAALAASFSRPGDSGDPLAPPDPNRNQAQSETRTQTETAPSATPGDTPAATGGPPATLEFDAAEDQTRRLDTDAAATVEVRVDEPGQVSIPLLGLSNAAEPVTPARFDVLVPAAGDYPIFFEPARGNEEREVGTLSVTDTEE